MAVETVTSTIKSFNWTSALSKGLMFKEIGSGARLQMQKLIDGPVYLELFVRVVPHWRQKPGRLAELGYRGE